MSNDTVIAEAPEKTEVDRNSFDKWGAAIGDTAEVGFGLKKTATAAQIQAQSGSAPEGKWIAADCWADCGSKGYNKAYVVDGVVMRMGTDDTIPDSFDHPQLRACARGAAMRLWLLGADRLKYPMKRKHWAPGGGRKELRGRDEGVRISWDEALDILSSELQRIKENYGNKSILGAKIGVIAARTLALYGGFTDKWAKYSGGTWTHSIPRIGFEALWNDRYDLLKSRLFILWGANPVWSQAGLPAYTYLQAKKDGARFIAIDPFYNPTYEMLTDEWLPIRPATDQALLLGMIHTILVEDKTSPLIDWDFLNRCAVGFDRDHMPKGANPDENFMDYVLGKRDGQPKDAEWASEICGTPAERIRWLALEYAREENASICTSGAPARVDDADSVPQLFMTLGAMTGHLGKSGSMVSVAHHFGTNGGPQLVKGHNSRSYNPSHTRAPDIGNPLAGNRRAGDSYGVRIDGCINLNEINTAVLTGKYTAGRGDIRDIDIRMIYHAHGASMNQLPNTLQAVQAHRKVDFVVTQNMFMTTEATYSDLVLPVTSRWERDGNVCIGYREQLLWHSKVMDPYFECKDDLWIAVELAKRLGIDPKLVEPWSWKQEIFNQVADARVMKDDGKTWEPLVTITEQDLKEYGLEGVPQQGRIPIKQFQEDGIYHIPRRPDDNHGYVYLKEFREDPEKYPLKTASGKLEIHCQALADYVYNCGWSVIKPIPTYNAPLEGYEATFRDWKNKIKGDYPLQLYNIHMPRNAHSFFDNTWVLREAFPHEFLMNPIDAGERGIKNGDTVLIRSRWGKVVRTVWVTNLMMPGVTVIGQGARMRLDEETGIDMGGCANVLKGATPTGGGHLGWNSCIVQVEKWTGKPLPSDAKLPPIVPLREKRA